MHHFSGVPMEFEKFSQIDPRLFRAFDSAAQLGSFTLGAQKAGMTQSGMSQHIARLEEQLGVPLFERVNKKVLLTTAGQELRNFLNFYSDSVDSFVERLRKNVTAPKGIVKY